MKKNNKKGFTLAELLIVVAIIAVLVAIAIPVFTKRLEASRETADIANLRSAYAAAQVAVLSGQEDISQQNMYFNPNTSTGLDTNSFSLGKGTTTQGGADINGLPTTVTYNRTVANEGKGIQIEFDGVTTAAGRVVAVHFDGDTTKEAG